MPQSAKENPAPSQILRTIIALWAHQKTAFYVLPALMIILIVGTVMQSQLGLYTAQKLFFMSPFIWLGPFPLPGTPCLLAVILAGLLLKFIFHSQWRWVMAGINLAHLGILLLLIGAVATSMSAEEGTLTIFENDRNHLVYDYHQRELVISRNDLPFAVIPESEIVPGKILQPASLPFQVKVVDTCRDCSIVRKKTADKTIPHHGMAQAVRLVERPSGKPDEAKLYGMTFDIEGAAATENGRYLTFDISPKPVVIPFGDDRFMLRYGKAERPLPFAVELQSFEKSYYPGTDKARSYHSDAIIHDGAVSWPARIEMNKPLRYKNYTLFQSSFFETEDGTATVLSVVRNKGWLLPYFGTAIMSAGLLLHFLLSVLKRNFLL